MEAMLHEMPGYPQGEPAFVSLLKQHEPFISHWDESRECAADELDVRPGLNLQPDFPDPDCLLDTAFADFRRFLSEAGLTGGRIPVHVREFQGLEKEEYRLDIGEEEVVLVSSETEGIRRGLYYLQDLIAGSPFLTKGSIHRKPWLKNRISRCFFGPIKRPPFNIDELMNDIDYYPEEYLSRLAHEGINGLWLTVTFRELCDTSVRKAPPDAARRLAKLRLTVERCRRYGIKTWVFCIEPTAWCAVNGNPLPPGCEEMMGPLYMEPEMGMEMHSFCVNSPKARQYLYECAYSIFSAVPHLGGMITISHGERLTSCLSQISLHSDGKIPCDKGCGKSIGEILSGILGTLKKGMNAANPEAELISWLYMPYVEQISSWITQMPAGLNSDVALAFNFESGVTKNQVGAVRAGGDYWLSEVGPSDRFALMAQAAKGHCQFAAKLQVACSHECATVPYIPAPGLIYRKYKSMKVLGVSHVMQCWYFGNYPGIMNEAAGKLAYEDFTGTEEDFLNELARPHWGRDYRLAVEAWKHFADGYSNYPLDIQFQYYGPMHDGPVWPLHLKLAMKPLTRSWKPETFPSGDAVGESMKHFELHEQLQLVNQMSAEWHRGLEILQQAEKKGHELEFTLSEALDIQFRSGRNILKFYSMRNALLDSPADAAVILAGMKPIVREEIENSLRLAELCRLDARLGYHSEAEVYKYFPAKLEWRAKCLQALLQEDFAQAEEVLGRGGKIGAFLEKGHEVKVAGKVYGTGKIHWSFDSDSEQIAFHLDVDGYSGNPETLFLFFMDRRGARRPLMPFAIKKEPALKTGKGWHAEFSISRAVFGYQSEICFGTEHVEFPKDGQLKFANDKEGEFMHEVRLNLKYFGADKLSRIRL